MLRAVMLLAITCGLAAIFWLLNSQPTKQQTTGKVSAVEKAQKTTSERTPWNKSESHRKQQAPGAVEGNPSEPTPAIDAWLEQNWKNSDEKLIDGLIEFAQRPDMGVGEKSKALEHALNMITESEYGKLDGLLGNKQTSPLLVRQVYDDMHNRGELASLRASLKLLGRQEPEVVEGARDFLAHFLDLDPESDIEAIRMQGETRILELQEEKATDVVELPPDAPLPPLPPNMEESTQ